MFSILLFYSTVCFHFAEQINDDDDDDEAGVHDNAGVSDRLIGLGLGLRQTIMTSPVNTLTGDVIMVFLTHINE